MLEGRLTLCNPNVGVQEDRSGAANHGTVHGTYYRRLQVTQTDKALDGIEQEPGRRGQRRGASRSIRVAAGAKDAPGALQREGVHRMTPVT